MMALLRCIWLRFCGSVQPLISLLKQDGDVNAVAHNPTQVQPLHSACAGNDTDICLALIKHGADANAVQQGGFTPLHAAAQNGNPELVAALLAAGATKAAMTATGATPQKLARDAGHVALAEHLVPPIGAFNRVTVFVKDMRKMRTFYERVLGLTHVGYADAGWVTYSAGGGNFISLHKQTRHKRSGGTAVQIVFHVADVAAARAELIARGAKTGQFFESPHLSFCDGVDPEGNPFQISSR